MYMDGYKAANSIEYFQDIWEGKRGKNVRHSPEIWDNRADEWIAELKENPERKMGRVRDTAAFFRSRGLLTEGSTAVDVGCGPGLFAAEFAKTAGSALGIDYSPRFIGYAGEIARAKGLDNAQYECCDFIKEDTSRYDGRFDFAFSSITPATSTWTLMQKFMRLSRAFCCNVSFVNIKDSIAEMVSGEVFGEPFRPRWNGNGFYALFNILWLRGYYPETHYYEDVWTDIIKPTPDNADYFAQLCRHNDKEEIEKVLHWLEKKGELKTQRVTRYGLVLWDKRRKDER
jgi:SAM-dependent methyltransferase